MLTSQKLQMEMSECRQAINSFEGEGGPELDNLTKNYQKKESEYRAALVIESEENGIDKILEGTAEGRELRDLFSKTSISDFVLESQGKNIDGASKEYRQAIMGSEVAGYMPLEMLLSSEQRADAVTNIGTAIQENQQAIIGRIFAQTASDYMGVSMPTVPVGTVTYPRISAGTTGDVRNAGVELDGTAATIASESINPHRLTASYTYSLETDVKIVGFEEALRSDIHGVLAEKEDFLSLNGQAAVANMSPKVDGLINSLPNPTDPGDVADYAAYLDLFDSHVDGKYAVSAEQVRMLVNPATWRQAMKLTVGSGNAAELFRIIFRRQGSGLAQICPTLPLT